MYFGDFHISTAHIKGQNVRNRWNLRPITLSSVFNNGQSCCNLSTVVISLVDPLTPKHGKRQLHFHSGFEIPLHSKAVTVPKPLTRNYLQK